MRVNVYAEELDSRNVEIVEKSGYRGVRIYLTLPVTVAEGSAVSQVRGRFFHRPGDDDSSAITFWGHGELHRVLTNMLRVLEGQPPFG